FEEVLAYSACAAAIARMSSFDVIHAHDWLSFLAGLEAKRVSGKPLIVHVHATEFDRTGGTGVNARVYDIERRGMQEADRVIAVSQWTKNIIVEHYGVSPEKIEVVHNGVEERDFRRLPSELDSWKAQGKKIVLFHGRVTLQKGPDYFLRTARRVLEFFPQAVFVVSGIGDMLPQMVREAVTLGISDKVFFVGALWDEERDKMYQAADVVMMPSVSEPFGIVPLEALSNGAPVLISKQSGVSEVLSHALKSDFWDTDEMANKIVSILKNESLKSTLRANGNREASTVTWSKAAQKVLGVYKALVPA
ncbi:MAG: glycosyltransferase family 4 protein, partial [Candidatus Azambacteria bacterium]|nr:glycosyltransferase family 4 protein [Candidatus Azambacteria bacterium]